MATNEEVEQRVRQIQRDYVGFLDDSDREDAIYETAIQEMVKAGANRQVNFVPIISFD